MGMIWQVDRQPILSARTIAISCLLGLLGLGLVAMVQHQCSGQGAQMPQPARITIDMNRQYQTIEGFGTALVSWKPEFERYYEGEDFRRLYLENLDASVLRVDLWADSVPEFDHPNELSYRDFLLDGPGRRGGFFLHFAEELSRHSHDELRVIASVWSPPAWMKVGGTRGNGAARDNNFALGLSELKTSERVYFERTPDGEPGDSLRPSVNRDRFLHDNRLRPDRYEHFAKALLEWVRLYRSRGIELYALSPQNEPRFSHWFESCSYLPEELAELTEIIIRTFAKEGERLPPLFAPETMTHDVEGNRAYLEALFRRPLVAEHLAALATHGYVDGYKSDEDPDSPARFLKLARPFGKPVWVTEGGTGLHEWPEPIHGIGTALINTLVRGNAALVTPWQVASATADVHGLTTLDGPTKKTFVAIHFFRFIRPGMIRVETTGDTKALKIAAFLDQTEHRLVLLVLNRSSEVASADVSINPSAPFLLSQVFITDKTRNVAPLPTAQFTRRISAPPESIMTLVYAQP